MGGVTAYPTHAGIGRRRGGSKAPRGWLAAPYAARHVVEARLTRALSCLAEMRSILANAVVECRAAGEEDHRLKRSAESKAAETRGRDPPAIQSEMSGPPETNVGKGG